MNVSSISSTERKNMFISYANRFMNFGINREKPEIESEASEKKLDKVKGIETLTIFPKQVIDGKTVFTA